MKNLIKKITMLSAVLGVAVLMAGCTNCGKKQMRHQPKPAMQQQTTETVVFYQTYEDSDINHVEAKMYTHSSHGGESRMGNIKFVETDAGLKMEVDVTDLRPGKVYTVKIVPCSGKDGTNCSNSYMNVDLPTLSVAKHGRLKESFIIRGLTAEQLDNCKLYLERDGGYKAAWGTLKKGMML